MAIFAGYVLCCLWIFVVDLFIAIKGIVSFLGCSLWIPFLYFEIPQGSSAEEPGAGFPGENRKRKIGYRQEILSQPC